MGEQQSRNKRTSISGVKNLLPLMQAALPEDLVQLLQLTGRIAGDLSTRAFIVGGVVRDILLGRKSLDIDVVIEGDAMRMAEALSPHAAGKLVFNRAFTTATVPLREGFHIDIAAARTETYEAPGALPTVSPAAIEQDLRRRDFTINSACASLTPASFGDVFDPHGGLRDMEIGLLKVLHDRSFVDDPTRIIRGIKYVNRFKFVFDHKTLELAEEAICDGCLKTISPHRLTDELRLLFVEQTPWGAIWDLAQLCVLTSVSPYLSLSHNALPILQRIESLESDLSDYLPEGYRAWLARLLLFMGNVPASELTSTLALFDLDKNEASIVSQFVTRGKDIASGLNGLDRATDSDLFELFSSIPAEAGVVIAATFRNKSAAGAFERYWSVLSKTRLEISGEDIKGMGIEQGPLVGEILRSVLAAKINEKIKGRQAELAMAQELVTQANERLKNEHCER
ncbi:MAG: CCA tRNA nucleotidyltransferase [Candidatus Coatesbacteria bacterium]|nr:CCA tRNA nucleotidyltransferase [Candidatus Coatesbacteria bacterium]